MNIIYSKKKKITYHSLIQIGEIGKTNTRKTLLEKLTFPLRGEIFPRNSSLNQNKVKRNKMGLLFSHVFGTPNKSHIVYESRSNAL